MERPIVEKAVISYIAIMKKLFEEEQRFTQWWIWALLIGINLIVGTLCYQQIVLGQIVGSKPIGNIGLIVIWSVVLLICLFVFINKLHTIVREDGIYVRFFPFHLKFKFYGWDKLSACYVRKYSPLMEYGGWGLRLSLFGQGSAYNVSGNKGLQLQLHNHKKLLIGTQKADDLQKVLENINQIKNK